MKNHHTRKLRFALPLAGVAAVCSLVVGMPVKADAFSITGQSDTIFRMRESSSDKKNLYPLYEYLKLSLTDLDKAGAVSFEAGGWVRADLADKSTDKYYETDLNYGYLSYRPKMNNAAFNVGRQFVAEGVAAERLDGLYLRSDLAAGFGAAAFAGAPVVTEPTYSGGDLIYGGRVTQSLPNYYTVGVSALQTEKNGRRIREEEGVDLWLHPVTQIDVVGRSSYNSLTSDWMEHAYTVSYSPLANLQINGDLSKINYRDYFYHVTTSALSLTNGILNPNEKSLALGGSIGYTPIKNLTVAADYKNYDYDIAGHANYFGGKATYSLPENFSAGFSVHRMDGVTDRLRYDEYRVYAAKKLGKLDLTVDYFDVHYDNSINGIKNTFSLTGAAAYDLTEQLKVSADVDYAKNPDFDNEVQGFMKITYAFETRQRGTEAKE